MLDLTINPTINPTFRLQFEQAQDSYVLLYPEGMVKLNNSAATILQYCDGNHNIQYIIDDLKIRFVDQTDIAKDVMSFIQQAYQKKWLK